MMGGLRLGVVLAMEKEYQQLLGHLLSVDAVQPSFAGRVADRIGFQLGYLGTHTFILVCSGIGKVNAALATQLLLSCEGLDGVLSVGVSGGLLPDSAPGNLVVGSRFAYHDVWCGEPNHFGQIQGFPAYYESDVFLFDRIRRSAPYAAFGCFLCGEYFVPEQVEVERMVGRFPGAVAVDMESCAVAQTCYICGVPFASIRIVSDTPGRNGDPGAQYAIFWKERAVGAFAGLASVLALL